MPHRVFSLRRLWAIAANTFTELTRLKVFYVLLLFALVLIGSSLFVARLTFQQEFQVLKDVSLGAMNIFTALLAIFATARLLPEDVEHRTVYTILARPVPRFEYVLGKVAGVLCLLAVSLLAMTALFLAVLYLREQTVLADTTRQMAQAPPEQMREALAAIRSSTFNANLLPGIIAIYLKGCILAVLTFLISTFATSNIFSVVLAVFVYFIGHLQSTAREFWLQEQGASWLSRSFLALVALCFPDLQLLDFSDEIVSGAAIPLALFVRTSGLACFYLGFYLLLAIAIFNAREL
ncbi:MAG: ABC transporter permease [Chthoniobacterales bacterium]